MESNRGRFELLACDRSALGVRSFLDADGASWAAYELRAPPGGNAPRRSDASSSSGRRDSV